MSDAEIPNTSLWSREPAAIIGLAVAILNVVAIMLHLDDGVKAAIAGVITAAGAILVRSQVSPVSSAP